MTPMTPCRSAVFLLALLAVAPPLAAQNLITNPDFTSEVTPWELLDASLLLSHAATDGFPQLGAAEVLGMTDNGPFPPSTEIKQCISLAAAPAGVPLQLHSSAKPVNYAPNLIRDAVAYYSDACDIGFLEFGVVLESIDTQQGTWGTLHGEVAPPPAEATHGLVLLSIEAGILDASAITRFDTVFLGQAAIFADGFESGDTTAW